MSISLVQSNQFSPSGLTTSATVTLPSGITQGNLVVISVATGSNSDTFTGPSGWTQAVVNIPAGASTTIQTSLWYLVVGSAQAGQTSWTFTLTSSHSIYLVAEEWNSTTGWLASPVDVTAQGDTAGTPTTGTSIVSGTTPATAQADELWVASLAYKNSAQTESGITSGWTKDLESTFPSNNTMTMLYNVASATGTASCGYTIGTAQFWAGVVATFKPVVVVTNTWTAGDIALTSTETLNEVLTYNAPADTLTVVESFSFTATPTTTRYLTRLKIGSTAYNFDVFQNNTEFTAGPTISQTVTPSTFYWTKLRVQGNTLYGKVWQDGNAEPGWAIITQLDSQVITGSIGALLSSTSATLPVKVDHLSVTNLGGPTDSLSFVSASPTSQMNGSDQSTVSDSIKETLAVAVTENSASSDSASQTLTNTATDSLALSDVSRETLAFAPTDTATVAESVADVLALSLKDTATVVDASTGTVIATGTDSLFATDSTSDALAFHPSDQLSSIESTAAALLLSTIDTVGVAEVLAETEAYTNTDILSVLEALSSAISISIAEINALSESLLASIIIASSDSIAVSDLSRDTLVVALQDVLTSNDVTSNTQAGSFTDTNTTSDSLASASSAAANLADVALPPTESLALALSYVPVESLAETEIYTETLAFSRADSVGIAESVVGTINAVGSDLLTSSETDAFSLILAIVDSVSATDSVIGGALFALLDSVLLPSDTVQEGLAVNVVETAVSSDAVATTNAVSATDSLVLSDVSRETVQNNSSDSIAVVEVAFDTITALLVDSATSTDASTSTGIVLLSDSITATESLASSNAYVFSDSAVLTENISLTLGVNAIDQSTTSDTFSSGAVHLDSQMSGTDQSVSSDALNPTMIIGQFDQLGPIFDQSTETGQFVGVDTLGTSDNISPSYPGVFIDAVSVSESILVTLSESLSDTVPTPFEVDAFVLLLHTTETSTVSDALASASFLAMTSTDTSSSSDAIFSIAVYVPIDTTPASDGFAARPFALAYSIVDSSTLFDAVQGLASTGLTDVTLSVTDSAKTSFALSFSDALISADAAYDGVAFSAPSDSVLPSDSLIPFSYNNTLTDSLVPSDDIRAAALAQLGPDALYIADSFISSETHYMLMVQTVRSGTITMVVHQNNIVQVLRSGSVNEMIRNGGVIAKVRSGNLNEALS